MFVIIEWNQASHRPCVAILNVYDSREEAEADAQDFRDEAKGYGRGERFTVHGLVDTEEENRA